ncbi:hypothetical protein J2W37_000649 [Variovorax paradoxus]|uniref:hypothetical protein n=1 Tax=Variovorax paradoxus TaxID=34073 RepID=UPI002780282C|nr:hypothetical protein [Variovorax paradoxus]MDP9962943.1 hypothetical protein [Variovorax paradoxus]
MNAKQDRLVSYEIASALVQQVLSVIALAVNLRVLGASAQRLITERSLEMADTQISMHQSHQRPL